MGDGSFRHDEDEVDPDIVSDVYDYIDGVSLDDYSPAVWYGVLQKDIEASLAKTKKQLSRILEVFDRYVVIAPLIGAVLAASAVAFAPVRQWGQALAADVGLGPLWTYPLSVSVAVTFVVGALTYGWWRFVEYQRDKEKRRFFELRDRNWRALEHRLKTRQSLYKEQSMNEDPEVGPKGLMGSRLLGRHAWELWYKMRLAALIFGFDVDERVILKSRKIRIAGLTVLATLFSVWLFITQPTAQAASQPIAAEQVIVFETALGAAFSFVLTFSLLFSFWAGQVKRKTAHVKALFEPKLTEQSMRLIGVKPHEYNGKLDWPEQYGYDDLEYFLVWLKSRYEILEHLRDQKFPYPGMPDKGDFKGKSQGRRSGGNTPRYLDDDDDDQ